MEAEEVAAVAARVAFEVEGLLKKVRQEETRRERTFESEYGAEGERARNLIRYRLVRQNLSPQLLADLTLLGWRWWLEREAAAAVAVLEQIGRLARLLASAVGEGQAEGVGWPPLPSPEERRSERARALLGKAPLSFWVVVTAAKEWQRVGWHLAGAGADGYIVQYREGSTERFRERLSFLRSLPTPSGERPRLFVTLEGGVLRVGELRPGPPKLRLKPVVATNGEVLQPARLRILPLSAAGDVEEKEVPTVFVLDEVFVELRAGAELRFEDDCGKRRTLSVVRCNEEEALAVSEATCVLTDQVKVRLEPEGKKRPLFFQFLGMESKKPKLVVHRGDHLILTKEDLVLGGEVTAEVSGPLEHAPAFFRVPVNFPEALEFLEVGQQLWLGDGRIGGRVIRSSEREVEILVDVAPRQGGKIFSGIEVVVTGGEWTFPPLSEFDRALLPYLVKEGDGVVLPLVTSALELAKMVEAIREVEQSTGISNSCPLLLRVDRAVSVEVFESLLLEGIRYGNFGVWVIQHELDLNAISMGRRYAELARCCQAAGVPTVWSFSSLSRAATKGVAFEGELEGFWQERDAAGIVLPAGPFVGQTISALQGSRQKSIFSL
ncbi:MAG: pyruvate kinase [Hydrogenophilus sp.]|nr:pyruvate kinase [Hydrogenophilus sp.]